MKYTKKWNVLVDKTFYTVNIKSSDVPWYGQPRLDVWVNTTAVDEIYSTDNVTETRSFDATTATTWDIANALGSLIQDLQNLNLLK